jgi:hypothetical protein
VRAVGRLLTIAGGIGVVVSVFLPWVTVAGTPLKLGLGLLSVSVVPGGRTVSGTGTSVWPIVLVVGLLVLALGLAPRAGRLLAVLGGLIALAGAGLTYYMANIVNLEADKHGAIVAMLANATITSSTGLGPPLLLASGVVILVGGLAASARSVARG